MPVSQCSNRNIPLRSGRYRTLTPCQRGGRTVVSVSLFEVRAGKRMYITSDEFRQFTNRNQQLRDVNPPSAYFRCHTTSPDNVITRAEFNALLRLLTQSV